MTSTTAASTGVPVALVTGGSSGIGLATLAALSRDGYRVYSGDREPGHDTVAAHLSLDVTDPTAWNTAVGSIMESAGRLDVLVNVAGVIGYSSALDLTQEEWAETHEVDQRAVWLGMREVIPHMIGAGSGSIVNVSSNWGKVGGPVALGYQMAKGGIHPLSRSAAVEFASSGIRVNTVVPGWVHTPLTADQDASVNDEIMRNTPLGRGGRPEEIAAAIAFLAGPNSSFITGTELVVDGGSLAR